MDSMENFFRNRTQEQSFEFNEADWLKLEAKLNERLPVTPFPWYYFKKFWFILLLLLLLPSSWIAYNQINNTLENENFTSLSSPTNETNLDNSIKPSNVEVVQKSKTSPTITKVEKTLAQKSNLRDTQSTSSITSNRQDQKNSNNLLFDEKQVNQGKKTDDIGYVVSRNGAESIRLSMDYGLHFLEPIVPTSEIHAGATPKNLHEVSSINPKVYKAKIASFILGLGYSPDFSTVGIGNFVSPGSRWKLSAEVGFLKRLQLQTGIVLVNNQYEAYGEDYHAPSRYWKKGIVADEAYGECKMIDIPLNLRYNFFIRGKHQIFISAGTSTYFVLKEDYYFHYEQDDPELPTHWGTEKTTIYPFGIINFSAGYQYMLGRKSALQVEPFIKIPTTGIGWGNVDLHTLGVYFMYKYRLGK